MKERARIRYPGVGAIIEIPLPGGHRGYARILESPLMAFYSIQSEALLEIEDVLKAPIAFKVWVMRSAVTSGRWRLMGLSPLETEHAVAPWFFKEDGISKTFSLYQGGIERPATKQECEGLERAAVWSAEHIESRLEDYFLKRPNRWVESLALKA